jgi:hypothetical protein
MSTIKVDTIKTTSNVEVYTCKAWINFNGIGTVAIRGSENVSSLVDDATANYTINFTTAMSDANYCPTGMAGTSATNPSSPNLAAFPVNASSCKCELYNTNNQNIDYAGVFLAIFR